MKRQDSHKTYTKKTGWPPGLLQDDCHDLSRWLSNRLGARHIARMVAKQIEKDKK